MAANNTILEAKVKLTIDSKNVDKQVQKTADKLQKDLAKADQRLSKQLTRQIDRDIGRISRTFERAADKLSIGLERAIKVGLGVGTTAIYTFLKSGTPEALKFANSLDKVKMAWGRVGQTLATKIDFGGKNLTEWAEVLIDKLENLDISQINKMVTAFKTMVVLWASIKIGLFVSEFAKLVGTFRTLIAAQKALKLLGAGSSLTTGLASAAGASVGAGVGVGVGSTFVQASEMARSATNPVAKGFFVDAALASKGSNSLKAMGKAFNNMRMQARFEGYSRLTSTLAGAKLAGGIGLGIGTRVLGRAIPFAGAAYDTYQGVRGGQSLGRSAGAAATGMIGAIAGMKVGAIAGTAAGPIGTAIGGLVGAVLGYFSASRLGENIFYKRGKKPKSEEELIAEAENKSEFTPDFTRSIGSLMRADAFGKNVIGSSGRYVGGNIPLEERKKLLPDAISTFTSTADAIKQLESAEQTNTVKGQIDELNRARDAVKQFIDGTIELYENQTDAQKAFTEKMEDFDERVSELKAKGIKEEAEGKKSLDELVNPEKAPKGGSISSGSIEDLPSIISSAINDQANEQAEKAYELQQIQKEIAEKTLDLQETKEAREKELADLEKQRAREQKEYEALQLKATQTTNERLAPLISGSSTVLQY